MLNSSLVNTLQENVQQLTAILELENNAILEHQLHKIEEILPKKQDLCDQNYDLINQIVIQDLSKEDKEKLRHSTQILVEKFTDNLSEINLATKAYDRLLGREKKEVLYNAYRKTITNKQSPSTIQKSF